MTPLGLLVLLAPLAPAVGAGVLAALVLLMLGFSSPTTVALLVALLAIPWITLRIVGALVTKTFIGSIATEPILRAIPYLGAAALFETGLWLELIEGAHGVVHGNAAFSVLRMALAIGSAVWFSAAAVGVVVVGSVLIVVAPLSWWVGERAGGGAMVRGLRLWGLLLLLALSGHLFADLVQSLMAPEAVLQFLR